MTQHPVGLTDTDEFKHIPFRSPAALELYRYAEQQAAVRRRKTALLSSVMTYRAEAAERAKSSENSKKRKSRRTRTRKTR
jgi:hypothetical protein